MLSTSPATRRVIVVGGAAVLGVLLVLLFFSRAGPFLPVGGGLWRSANVPGPPQLERILLRRRSDTEGLGSSLQHLKGSIILAEHVVNATFLVGATQSEHDYSTSRVLNEAVLGHEAAVAFDLAVDPVAAAHALLPPGSEVCQLSDFITHQVRASVLRDVCHERADTPALRQARTRLAACKLIVDDIDDEEIQAYNGCVRDFVRARLGAGAGRKSGTVGTLRVGIHVRWGDAAQWYRQTGLLRGSLQPRDMNVVVRALLEAFGRQRVAIKVAIEDADEEVLGLLDFRHEVDAFISTGDPVEDLRSLADADVLLIGGSSYGVLAHLLAPVRGVTVAQDNTFARTKLSHAGPRHVLFMGDYRASELVQDLQAQFEYLDPH